MKKLMLAVAAAVAGTVFGTTHNVPADGDLETVVAAAADGDEVVIAASETPYVLTAALTVPAGVTVRGATGDWKDVVVSGGDAVGGLTLSANSAVSNLTITACVCGAEGTAGAKVVKDSTLANCRVTACHATANRANGIGVNNAGTVRGCLIDGNYAPDTFTGNRGVGLYTSGSAALTEDTVIVGNWAAWLNTGNDTWTGHGAAGVRAGGGTFRRCYVGANSVGVVTVGSVTVGSGFFATGAVTIENCTIEGNTYDGPELETVPGLSIGNANSTMKNTVVLNNRHVDGVKNNAYIPSSYADSKYENNASDGVIADYAGEKMAIFVTEDDFVRVDGLLRPKPGSMASGLGALPDWDGVTPMDPVLVPVTNLVSDISLLQAAIDAAEPGDVVLIAKGNYTVTETIMVKDGVTVAGATGNRDDVVLDGNNAVRIANVTGATLKNVTLSRGYVKNTQACGAGAQLGRGGCLENCRVTGVTTINHMYATGMAVYNAGGRVRGCLIDGNSSAGSTYTSVAYYQSSGMIDRSVIRDNTCVSTSLSNGNFPGVVGCQVTSGVIRNCVITGNSPGSVTGASFVTGCGVRLTGAGTQMINCLVYGNTYYGTQSANLQGVGITDSNATVLNSVVLGNGYRDNPVQNFTGAARHRNNVTDKATADLCTDSFEGTIEGLFVKSGDDYDIKAGGDLVDVGAAQPVAEQGLDFYGRPRLGGERIDIGPFEYHVPPFAVTFESPVYFALDRLETTLTATASGDTAGTVYSWFLDDAEEPFSTGDDKQSVPFVLTELGTHTVTLRAVNGAGLADEFTQTYRVQQGTFVVNPGESIPDAIAAAEPGSTVLLKAGIHTNAATISVNKAITVRGESREGSVLYCGGTARGFVLSESGAVLADLTVSDAYGNAWKGVGVGVVLNTGTLMTNCVVRNCKSGNTDYGVGVYCSSARIVDSVITNCTGGCGTGVYMTGANSLVYRTLVRDNSCGYYASYPLAGGIYAGGGTVRGSVIADNSFRVSKWTQAYADASVLASGVRLDGSRLENCTVVGNVQTTPADQPEYDGLIGGVAAGGSACAVNSCLIAGNTGNEGAAADNALEKTYLSGYTTCCTSAIENFPEGNVSSVPGPVYRYSRRRGEYRLTQGSPCAGAGTWQTWMAGERDIYGRAWNPDRVDIGAAVYDCKGLMLMLK